MRRLVTFALTTASLFLLLGGCRAILGIEQGDAVEDGGRLFDGAGLDAGPDRGVRDTSVEAPVTGDAACVMCGTECVFTNTDVQNCGGCGVTCAATAPSTVACSVGRCVTTLATIPGTLARPFVGGGWVYVANTVTNGVVKVPAGGGDPVTILASGAGPLTAIDGASIYWSASNRLWSASLDGQNPRPMTPSFGSVLGMTADATGLYFASGSTVRVVDIRGGDPVTLLTAEATIRGLTSDATSFYFTDTNNNVSSGPRAGGVAPLKLAWNQSSPADVAVSGTDVYWVQGNSVMKVALGGGTWTPVATGIERIVIDGSNLYGRSPSAGAVARWTLGDPSSALKIIGPKGSAPDAIDATSIYWVENGSGVGRVMKLSPK